ncbi:MAG TPA: hypothetical protein VKD70_03890 [Candidatus Acidoferrum sp.]|nr:hypothetical protein [Candidatus Acidoferrum sp.]
MEFQKLWARLGFLAGIFMLIAGCKSAPTPERNSPTANIALPPEHTEPVENSADEDCGLKDYPVSRSNREILADVRRDARKPSYAMLAKIAIDKEGKITHLRVLRLAHSNASIWMEINDSALNDIKRWYSKPTFYHGRPVPICSDVVVTVDLR